MAAVAVAQADKAGRARALLAQAAVGRAALEASTALRCRECGRVLLKYDPPVGRCTLPCRRCGTWTDFSTERTPGS